MVWSVHVGFPTCQVRVARFQGGDHSKYTSRKVNNIYCYICLFCLSWDALADQQSQTFFLEGSAPFFSVALVGGATSLTLSCDGDDDDDNDDVDDDDDSYGSL